MKWYIMVVKASLQADKTAYCQSEVVKLGPFTVNQLPTMLNKITYKRGGAIQVYQGRY